MTKNVLLIEEIIAMIEELPANKERKELTKEITLELNKLEEYDRLAQITDLLIPLNRDGQLGGIIDKVKLFGAPGPRNKIIDKLQWLSGDALQSPEETLEALNDIKAAVEKLIASATPSKAPQQEPALPEDGDGNIIEDNNQVEQE